jgi:hypothetical protein
MSTHARLQSENHRLRVDNQRLREENQRLRATSPLSVHEQEDATSTTVVARIRALGVPNSKRLAWNVGAAVRRSWTKTYGTLPVKANTMKVSGTGSHCHARYPLAWALRIDQLIALHLGSASTTQLALFDGGAA